jgi:hypothetical protein
MTDLRTLCVCMTSCGWRHYKCIACSLAGSGMGKTESYKSNTWDR